MLKKQTKKYGNIDSLALVSPKSGKVKARMLLVDPRFGTTIFKPIKASADMLVRVVTTDEKGRRVTFFLRKA